MEYPSPEDYIKAVQQPERVFVRTELKQAQFALHPLLQIPIPAQGSTAVVFKATIGGVDQALRFFTREDASTRERYNALNTYFTARQLAEHMATSRWIDDAIRIKDRAWPLVRMEWVEGRTLDQYVEDLVEKDDTAALGSLAGAWRDLLHRMQAARFAHGDLQHGNVLVDHKGSLRLVDFDCAWIEPFAGISPPTESGHRNYQHPGRVWGPWMDTFPGLVVYTSLLALSKSIDPWKKLHNGENLLFRRQDYDPPYQTPAWRQVASLHDPQIDLLAGQLRACCAPTWSASGDLEQLLYAQPPWWERTRGAAGAFSTPGAALPPVARTGPLPLPPRIPPPRVSGPIPAGPARRDWPRTRGARSSQAGWWQQQPAPGRPVPLRPAPTPAPGPAGPADRSGRYAEPVLGAIGIGLVVGLVLAAAFGDSGGAAAAFALGWILTTVVALPILLDRARRRP
jgi:hypothetical protein